MRSMFNSVYAELMTRNFSHIDNQYKVMPLCGSDGVLRLDNRLSIMNMRKQCFKAIKSLSNVKPFIIGFRILDRNGMELGRAIFESREALESCGYYKNN